MWFSFDDRKIGAPLIRSKTRLDGGKDIWDLGGRMRIWDLKGDGLVRETDLLPFL